ncbi:polyprenyl synthetase family protein [Streptomyces chartreusis]|uniref:polyprenyl synthetase family protein n=1 Tax=Streptomyces chartreusis TaxID=1969 RepID=UPI00381F8A9E
MTEDAVTEEAVTEAAFALIEDAKERTDAAFRAAVARLPSPAYRMAAYGIGWSDPEGVPHRPHTSGKGMRLALALASAHACGGRPEDGVSTAVAVELVHNYSLYQDDAADNDPQRRGRPAAWRVWGKPIAWLVGEAMLNLAFRTLAQDPRLAGTDAVAYLGESAQRMIVDGQLADLVNDARVIGLDDARAMATAKCYMFTPPCWIGALAAGADAGTVRLMRQFGEGLSCAYQHLNDYEGMWSRRQDSLLEPLLDLRARKRSLPVVYALNRGGPAAARLDAYLRAEHVPDETELAELAHILEEAGARQWLLATVESLIEGCLKCLADAPLTEPGRTQLELLTRYFVRGLVPDFPVL